MQAIPKPSAAVVAQFARSFLLNGVQPASRLTAVTSLERKASEQILFAEGDEANNVYEILRGTVRLVKLLPDGRRQITGFFSAGHLLGLAPEGVHVYTAEAITEVTLCRYKKAALERLIEEIPSFAKRLLTATSHELSANQDQMLLLGRKTAMERVASFLLLMAEQQQGGNAREMDMPMTRCDIADFLGLTIETVSRTFTKLKQDGLIELLAPTRILIRDRGHLEELASGSADSPFSLHSLSGRTKAHSEKTFVNHLQPRNSFTFRGA
jgi:CRP/FNR family transcriptional regulator, anaerobic regulatory protein